MQVQCDELNLNLIFILMLILSDNDYSTYSMKSYKYTYKLLTFILAFIKAQS
jgi:hypothetical protein